MKLLTGILSLLFAILISLVAAYFSVVGLAALFAATFIPVVIMGATLEMAKLVAAEWLHLNWKNPQVNRIHKTYLVAAVGALMLITSIGIYGFLSKGHLEQEAPLEGIELQIIQREQQVKALETANIALNNKLTQLDKSIESFLNKDKASAGLRARNQQKAERAEIETEIKNNNASIQKLNEEILPLKVQTNEVQAKLGPIKYVAELFGWQDTGAAVRLVILILMFAFDPLAIVLLLSASITFEEIAEEKRKKEEQAQIDAVQKELDALRLKKEQEEQSSFDALFAQSVPVTQAQMEQAMKLVDGVEVDIDKPLDEQCIEDDPQFLPKEEMPDVTSAVVLPSDISVPDEPEPEQELEPNEQTIAAMLAARDMESRFETSEALFADLENSRKQNEYHQALKAFVDEAYNNGMSNGQSVVHAMTEPSSEERKQQLVELLEKQPDLLQELIDVISDFKKDGDDAQNKVQVPESEHFPAEPVREETDDANGVFKAVTSRSSWLSKPKL